MTSYKVWNYCGSATLRNKDVVLAESYVNTFTMIAAPLAVLNWTSKPSELKKKCFL